MINKRLNRILFYLFIVFIFWNCATIVRPEGGPKDETPPVMIESTPAYYSTGFTGKKIEMEFDEYIQLKNANSELVISPPLEKNPMPKVRGKSIILQFEDEDTLRDSTTYTLYFGNSIVDNNEGNKLENFQFAFATGDQIDTLQVKGRVIDAYTHEPIPGIIALLHRNHEDSAFFAEIPNYIGKSNDKGEFEISNISEGTYSVYALKDANGNYKYDSQEERIAFDDSLTIFRPILVENYDTIYFEGQLLDSLREVFEAPDSLFIDTVIYSSYPSIGTRYYDLYAFWENKGARYIDRNEREEADKITFIFNKPLKQDTLYFNLVDTIIEHDWFLYEPNPEKDSITVWITDTTLSKSDDIVLEVGYFSLDSMNNDIFLRDTSYYFFKQPTKKEQEAIDEAPIEYLKFQLPFKKGDNFDYFEDFRFKFDLPVARIDTSKFHLYQFIDDTLQVEVNAPFTKDSFYLKEYVLEFDWEPESSYKLYLDSMAITDIRGHYNDSLVIDFETHPLDYYGTIMLNLEYCDEPYLFILSQKDEVIRELPVYSSDTALFEYIKPGDYTIKAIVDANKNGKWDSGNFIEKMQPEKVIFNDIPITVKSNWDIEPNWAPCEVPEDVQKLWDQKNKGLDKDTEESETREKKNIRTNSIGSTGFIKEQ